MGHRDKREGERQADKLRLRQTEEVGGMGGGGQKEGGRERQGRVGHRDRERERSKQAGRGRDTLKRQGHRVRLERDSPVLRLFP